MPFSVRLTLGYHELQSEEGAELLVVGSEEHSLSLEPNEPLTLNFPSSIDFPGDRNYTQAIFKLEGLPAFPVAWIKHENKKYSKPLSLHTEIYPAVFPIQHIGDWRIQRFTITIKRETIENYPIILNLREPRDPGALDFIGPKEVFQEKGKN